MLCYDDAMTILIPFLTSLLTLITTCLVFWRTARQDKVLQQHGAGIEQVKKAVNGELSAIEARATDLQARAAATALYATQMQVYAMSLRNSLAIIAKAEAAGESVVNLRSTVASQLVRAPLYADQPVMLDP